LSDIVVVGIVNDKDDNGVFNPVSLARIYELTEYARTLRWPDEHDPDKEVGVIEVDLLAPSTVDHIGQGGPGEVRFEWLMHKPPTTQAEALRVRENAMSNPLLKGTVVSEDGRAICLYLPLTSKDLSYRVYDSLNTRIPVLWQWAPLSLKIEGLEVAETQKQALTRLGRLAAFYARNGSEFGRMMTTCGNVLAGADRTLYFAGTGSEPGDDWRTLREKVLVNWRPRAKELDEQTGRRLAQLAKAGAGRSKIDAYKANAAARDNQEFSRWLTEQSNSNKGWVLPRFAAFYAESLRGRVLSAWELLESVENFAKETADGLGGESADYAGLPQIIRDAVTAKIDFAGGDQYHITGLPVAEDTFGVEMFIQMAVSAPLAMAVIFVLMLLFFRKLVLVISPMIVAMVSVISTMGLLIGLGFAVHIMSSMIPIFLMPIAVVDSVHILSEFFDLYTKQKGRRDTILEVMRNLFMPMLYTSLTSAAGFASLAITPIPPVQVFGVFVAVGIMIAWAFTVTFVPAYIMFMSERSLENFGHEAHHAQKQSLLGRLLLAAGRFTYNQARLILIVLLIITAVAVYGITRIRINDNPVKWFSEGHPIRKADTELNKHFGGTYMAYLVLDPNESKSDLYEYIDDVRTRVLKRGSELKRQLPGAEQVAGEMERLILENASKEGTRRQFLENVTAIAQQKSDSADNKTSDIWFEMVDFFELEKEQVKIFKQPEVLRYISRLQKHLKDSDLVGKSNSVADVVMKVHQELVDGKLSSRRIPDSSAAVAQCLLQFQSSHNPDDLWHLVTIDYMHANIWLQLTSGDNKDMEKVVKAADRFFEDNPPPVSLKYNWAGLTYINTVWQNKMVWGMLQSFLGSFLIVFIMMAILFRSPLWGIVCMIPLLITITVIYGIIGLAGKDYDMPVAVLSALTLGMAVDFAIHFLERARTSYGETGWWKGSAAVMFGEPARAISRNVLVIAIGFLPLLAAPLVPYKTVGIFLCAIMGLSGAVTLLALPAIIKVMEKLLFGPRRAPRSVTCNCVFCLIISISVVLLVGLNLHQYWKLGWNKLAVISIIVVPLMALLCALMSRRQACNMAEKEA
jgi:predicted RND superfamily exporter protein